MRVSAIDLKNLYGLSFSEGSLLRALRDGGTAGVLLPGCSLVVTCGPGPDSGRITVVFGVGLSLRDAGYINDDLTLAPRGAALFAEPAATVTERQAFDFVPAF